MKPKEILIKSLPTFTCEAYFKVYSIFIHNHIEQILSKEEKQKLDKDIFTFESKNNNKNYWKNIIIALNEKDDKYSYIKPGISVLAVRYLNFKTKHVYDKMKKLCFSLNKSITYIINTHLEWCLFEINRNKFKTERLIQNNKSKKKCEIEFNFDDEEEKKKKSMVNLFIGNFDMSKFLNHEQTICMKKNNNVNTFIFTNVKKPKKKVKIFNSKKGNEKKIKREDTIDNQTLNLNIYGRNGKMNVYGFETMFQTKEDDDDDRNLYVPRKRSNTRTESRLITHIDINKLKGHLEEPKVRKRGYSVITRAKTSMVNDIHKKEKEILPLIITHSNYKKDNHFKMKKLKTENFLCKTDLYY